MSASMVPGLYPGRERIVTLATLTALSAHTLVKADSTRANVSVAGAGEYAVGALRNAAAAATAARDVAIYDLSDGDVVPLIAAAAIPRLTDGRPTRVVPAAGGKVQALPSTSGTHYVIGEVDVAAPAAAADGDVVYVQVRRGTAYTGDGEATYELTGGPDADIAADATATKTAYVVATGRAGTLRRVRLLAGVSADATVDVHVNGVSVLDAAVDVVSEGQTEIATFTDAALAADDTVAIVIVTQAGTGAVAAPQWFVKLTEGPA